VVAELALLVSLETEEMEAVMPQVQAKTEATLQGMELAAVVAVVAVLAEMDQKDIFDLSIGALTKC
jgi:hypothetical protein